MASPEGPSPPKAPRRAPAQRAAQEAGLPQDVFLHQNALGGFTESGRKPKRLKPGILGDKAKRRRKPAEDAAVGQRNLDDVPDDDVVVVATLPGPRGPVVLEEEGEPDAFPLAVKGPVDAARATIAQALYHEIGKPGSLLSLPQGIAFSVRPGLGYREVHTHHRIQVPLPGGNATHHLCDLAIELEDGALLVLDVLGSQSTMSEVKARAFDALQLRSLSQCYAVLVFLQGPGGLERDHIEAVAHGYDHFFGVPADHVGDPTRFTALKARVAQWIKAASGKR